MVSKGSSTLLELANEVQQLTTQIVQDLNARALPEPTFEPQSATIPETLKQITLRAQLNDAAQDLLRLVNGPRNDARTSVCRLYDLAAWQMACEFDLFEAIPNDRAANLKDIASKIGLDEDRTGRFLRMLASDRVFEEVAENTFKHTSRSALYLEDKQWRDVMHYQLDEFFKAASATSDSIKHSPSVTDGSNNAFLTRHGKNLFQFYKDDALRAARFASAMAGVSRLEQHFDSLKESFSWEQISQGKVIDVGGGSGHMSISLAKAFPNLELIVQDSVSMLASAAQHDFSDLNGRVTFMPHDFFTPQPVAGAAAYLLRYITHNWSDEDCIRIFRALVPALEKSAPGTPLLINDVVLPALGEASRYHENRMRQVDIMMMLVLGAKQRTEEQFQRLLQDADPRFMIKSIHGKGNMSLIEACLDTAGGRASQSSGTASLRENPSVAGSKKRTSARF